MSQLGELFKELKISEDKLKEMIIAISENPMAGLNYLQELELTPEFMQKVMGLVMTNPDAISEFGEELGISSDVLEKSKSAITGFMPST
ncbi:MAG: hypothetical protein CMP10_16165 [Zetaproteobacteria bacterium]|nr:hypothetical protein [Pseudobdellovibrionaceae bacterium]|tara:strand:- start:587 stop:853 length:267 start_codon:yes stop_codon:yes gene_type:complete